MDLQEKAMPGEVFVAESGGLGKPNFTLILMMVLILLTHKQSSSTCFVVDYGLGCSVTSPLSWRRTGDSADVQVMLVGSRSVMHAQVVSWSSIGTLEAAQEKF